MRSRRGSIIFRLEKNEKSSPLWICEAFYINRKCAPETVREGLRTLMVLDYSCIHRIQGKLMRNK